MRGDILAARDRRRVAGLHYIIYYDRINTDEFLGAIITTSGNYPQNIPMLDEHFTEFDADGNAYQITNNNSYLVPAKLIKLESWGPFTKVGSLTNQGIRFIERIIGDLEPIVWEDAIRRVSR